jgi:hypothetical protein
MPKVVKLTEETIVWLRANHRQPISHVAARIGCHVDTAKRILVRLNLADYPGAKYQKRQGAHVEHWRRPCMGCGNTDPRPKTHYFCRRCRAARGFET